MLFNNPIILKQTKSYFRKNPNGVLILIFGKRGFKKSFGWINYILPDWNHKKQRFNRYFTKKNPFNKELISVLEDLLDNAKDGIIQKSIFNPKKK